MHFRAWDVEGKCWIPKERVAVTAEGGLLTYEPDEDRWMADPIEWKPSRKTAFVDKHGKRLYEGDVFAWDLPTVQLKFVVEYLEAEGVFFASCTSGGGGSLEGITAQCPIVIIGNVFENPELIAG